MYKYKKKKDENQIIRDFLLEKQSPSSQWRGFKLNRFSLMMSNLQYSNTLQYTINTNQFMRHTTEGCYTKR